MSRGEFPARGSPPLQAQALAQQLERRVPVPGLETVRVAGVPTLGLPQLEPERYRFAKQALVQHCPATERRGYRELPHSLLRWMRLVQVRE